MSLPHAAPPSISEWAQAAKVHHKSEMETQEKLSLTALITLKEWNNLLPSIGTIQYETPPEFRPAKAPNGDHECYWNGCLPYVSARFPAATKPEVAGRRYLRSLGCACALQRLAEFSPNYTYANPDSAGGVHRIFNETGPLMAAPLQIPLPLHRGDPTGRVTTFQDILQGDSAAPLYSVASLFLQAAYAVLQAHATLRFAHNALDAKAVLLSPHAPVFSLNFYAGRRSSATLLCFGHAAVLSGYSRAQYSYLRTSDNSVVDVPPEHGEALNLQPHPATDIYRLAHSCYTLAESAKNSLPITQHKETKTRIYDRCQFFRSFLDALGKRGDYGSKDVGCSTPPHLYAEAFLRVATQILNASGLPGLLRPNQPFYGNPHIANTRDSSWYAADIRALSAWGLPPQGNRWEPGTRGFTTPGSHLRFPSTQRAHDAAERLLGSTTTNAPADIQEALEEFPLLYVCTAEQRHAIAKLPGATEALTERVARILDTPVAVAPPHITGPALQLYPLITIRDILTP